MVGILVIVEQKVNEKCNKMWRVGNIFLLWCQMRRETPCYLLVLGNSVDEKMQSVCPAFVCQLATVSFTSSILVLRCFMVWIL